MTEHVKIYAVPIRKQYLADGTSQDFDFPFMIFENNNLKVYWGDEEQADSTYTITLTNNSTGGTVHFNNIPAAGTVVTLLRKLTIERKTDFLETIRPEMLNQELDFQIACQQQIADNLNRSMVLPPYAVSSDVNLTLPLPQAGKAIVWNADGTNLENSILSVNEMATTMTAQVNTATQKADIAQTAAQTATAQAETATVQAAIATEKADEATITLTSKANTDMDNLSGTGKVAITSLGMPDYSNTVFKAWNTEHIAESNGYLSCCTWCNGNGTGIYAIINGQEFFRTLSNGSIGNLGPGYEGGQQYAGCSFPIGKGDTYKLTGGSALQNLLFTPMKGENV